MMRRFDRLVPSGSENKIVEVVSRDTEDDGKDTTPDSDDGFAPRQNFEEVREEMVGIEVRYAL